MTISPSDNSIEENSSFIETLSAHLIWLNEMTMTLCVCVCVCVRERESLTWQSGSVCAYGDSICVSVSQQTPTNHTTSTLIHNIHSTQTILSQWETVRWWPNLCNINIYSSCVVKIIHIKIIKYILKKKEKKKSLH